MADTPGSPNVERNELGENIIEFDGSDGSALQDLLSSERIRSLQTRGSSLPSASPVLEPVCESGRRKGNLSSAGDCTSRPCQIDEWGARYEGLEPHARTNTIRRRGRRRIHRRGRRSTNLSSMVSSYNRTPEAGHGNACEWRIWTDRGQESCAERHTQYIKRRYQQSLPSYTFT